MTRRHVVSVALAGLAVVNIRALNPIQPAVAAFVDVTVLPMDRDGILPRQTVVVRGDLIAAIGPVGSVAVPDGARQIDGRGRYLMPGLADMHVHLRAPAELLAYLAHGVTTIANLGGAVPDAPDILGYKRLIAAGALAGPTIYTSGPLVDSSPLIFKATSVLADTPEEARAVVAAQKAAGYDMVKVYQMLKPEVYDAVLTAARDMQMPVVGHVPQTIDLARALNSGQVMIAHGTFFLEPLLDATGASYDLGKLAPLIESARARGVTVTPNLITGHLRSQVLAVPEFNPYASPEFRFLHPSVERAWRGTTPAVLKRFGRDSTMVNGFLRQLTPRLQAAGVRLLVGTDASAAMPGLYPGASIRDEIALLIDAGLTRHQALTAATRSAGDFVAAHLDPQDSFGVVRADARADLLLLEGNPRDDVRHLSKVVGVMARGRWFTAAELAHLREVLARQRK